MKYKVYLFLLLGLVYAGCRHNHEYDNDHDHSDHAHNEESHDHSGHDHHDHEEPKLILTAYNTTFELFAEADPFVVGEETEILSHITYLSNFKPLDSAAVTLKLGRGNEMTQVTLDNPKSKGIYHFMITPKTAGKSTLVYEVNLGNRLSTIEIPVEVFSDEEDAHTNAESLEIDNPNAISFTKEKSWKIDFATEAVTKEKFGQVLKCTGQVLPAQSDKVVITAKTSGIVELKSNNILEGRNISAGEAILNINASGMAKNNSSVEFIEAKSNYENARAVYERQIELAKDKIVSEKELLNSKKDYENYKAIYDNLNRNFSSSGQVVVSPISGFISEIYKKNGEYIEAGEPVLTVIKNKELNILTEVQYKYSGYLKDLHTATIKAGDRSYTLEDLGGKIVSVGKSLSNTNFTIPVTLQVQNNGQFIPGEFVQLFLKSSSPNVTMTIPTTALLEEQGLYYVLVQVTPELFEKKEVKPGATDGIKTQILAGLEENDRVVTKGAMLVKLSQVSGALDPHAGHVH